MTKMHTVAVLVGSLRKGAYSRMLANALTGLAAKRMKLTLVEIGDLPFYNPDLDEESAPSSWVAFRKTVASADAVLFVTPEYNRSVPAVLKNALDVGSRPYGASVWNAKPGAVISISPGAISGFGANHHLRQSLVFLNVLTLQQPEAYLGGAGEMFDGSGNFTTPATREFMTSFLDAFANWIDRLCTRS